MNRNTAPENQFRLRFALGLFSMNFLTAPAKSATVPNTMKVATTNSAPRINIWTDGLKGLSIFTAGGINDSAKSIAFGFVRFMMMPRK